MRRWDSRRPFERALAMTSGTVGTLVGDIQPWEGLCSAQPSPSVTAAC